MKAIKFFKEIKKLKSILNIKVEELNEMRSLLNSISINYDKLPVQTTKNYDVLGDSVARVIDYTEKLNADIKHYIDIRSEANSLLDMLDNADMRRVLYMRYFQDLEFDDIAKELFYTRQWINVLHGRALKILDTKMKSLKMKNKK